MFVDAGNLHHVRSPLFIVLPALLTLAACGGEGQPDTPVPSDVPTVTQTGLPPAPEPIEAQTPTPVETTSAAAPTPEQSAAPSPTSSPTLSPIAEPTPEGGPWTAMDVTAASAEELAGAEGIPETFHTFMEQRIGVEDDAGCTISSVEIKAVHRDGFIFGSEDSTCGVTQVVWGITDQAWNYIVAFLDVMPCADLEMNGVPADVPGLRCVDAQGQATDY